MRVPHGVGEPQPRQTGTEAEAFGVCGRLPEAFRGGGELAAPELLQGEEEGGVQGGRQHTGAPGLLAGLVHRPGAAVACGREPGQPEIGGGPERGESVGMGERAGPQDVRGRRRLVLFRRQPPEQEQRAAGPFRQAGPLGGVRAPAGEGGGGGEPVGRQAVEFDVRGGDVDDGAVGVVRPVAEQQPGDVDVADGLRGAAGERRGLGEAGVQTGPAGGRQAGVAGEAVGPGRHRVRAAPGHGRVQQPLQHGGPRPGRGGGAGQPVCAGEQFQGAVHRAVGGRPAGRLAVQPDGLPGLPACPCSAAARAHHGPGSPGWSAASAPAARRAAPARSPGPRPASTAGPTKG
ncbi:hypothetical protein ACFQ60_41220 [Streptomyces zhihengii]